MIRRILIGVLAFVVLAAGSFVTYGWLTRRGAPSFQKGGAFGLESPAPTLPSSERPASEAPSTSLSATPSPSDGAVRPSNAPPRLAGPSLAIPAEGTYTYEGSGKESVRFGSTPACSWGIEDVTAVVKHQRAGVVMDWTYSAERLERHVFDYRARSIRLTYVGAAVTCLGVRQTSEDEYLPPSRWIVDPWDIGSRWTERTQAGERIEDSVSRVVARERITVPAGRFTTYKIKSTTTFSGDSGGTHTSTTWFSPTLGMNIKRISSTTATRGSATFSSEMTLVLSAKP